MGAQSAAPTGYRSERVSHAGRVVRMALMLVGLKQPLSKGQTILLKIRMSSGRRLTVPVQAI